MDTTKTHPCHTIIELDHYHPKVGMTLRQAIMHIFSSSRPSWNLFVAVDTSYYGDSVLFAFRDEVADKATNMISFLPIFLEAATGKSAVWDWFTTEARMQTSYYSWDENLGIQSNKANSNTDTTLANWENLDDIDEEYDGASPSGDFLHPFILDLNSIGPNLYNDNGSIETEALASELVPFSTTESEDDTSRDVSTDSTVMSTLTRTEEELKLEYLQKMAADPFYIETFAAMILANKAHNTIPIGDQPANSHATISNNLKTPPTPPNPPPLELTSVSTLLHSDGHDENMDEETPESGTKAPNTMVALGAGKE